MSIVSRTKTDDPNTAHGDVTQGGIFKYEPACWEHREFDAEDSYGYPFRQCSHCGSIHPADLLQYLKQGARIHWADFKYGWPHKIYVDGIPSPRAGHPHKQYTYCGRLSPDDDPAEWEQYETGKFDSNTGKPELSYCKLTGIYPNPAETPTKFYSIHLKDADDATFTELAEFIAKRTGVRFKKDAEGKIMYGPEISPPVPQS